jgi:hypothetical protein
VPGIIRCPNNHVVASAAKVGGTTSCPECRREGRGRVSCRVHPAPAATGATAYAGGDTADLAAAWAAETPPAGWRSVLGEPGGGDCPDCSVPLRWTGAHTALICPECRAWSVSPGAGSRAAARAASLERRASGGTLALTPGQARATRVHLRARQDALSRAVAHLADQFDPADFDQDADRRPAVELAALLRAYLPEISAAAAEGELAELAAELQQIREDPRFAELQQTRADVAERRAAAQQREIEQQRAEHLQERAEHRQAIEAARAAEREAAAEARAEARAEQQQASARPPARPLPAAPYALGLMIKQRQDWRAEAIARKGACGFVHKWADSGTVPAARLFGIAVSDWQGTWLSAEAPSIRACSKHFAAAEQWMNGQGYPACTYWKL